MPNAAKEFTFYVPGVDPGRAPRVEALLAGMVGLYMLLSFRHERWLAEGWLDAVLSPRARDVVTVAVTVALAPISLYVTIREIRRLFKHRVRYEVTLSEAGIQRRVYSFQTEQWSTPQSIPWTAVRGTDYDERRRTVVVRLRTGALYHFRDLEEPERFLELARQWVHECPVEEFPAIAKNIFLTVYSVGTAAAMAALLPRPLELLGFSVMLILGWLFVALLAIGGMWTLLKRPLVLRFLLDEGLVRPALMRVVGACELLTGWVLFALLW